jgi:hypothetical protein
MWYVCSSCKAEESGHDPDMTRTSTSAMEEPERKHIAVVERGWQPHGGEHDRIGPGRATLAKLLVFCPARAFFV